MKIKILLALSFFIIHTVSTAAQLPNSLSTTDIFSLRNNQSAANWLLNSSQNLQKNSGAVIEADLSAFTNKSLFNSLSAKCADSIDDPDVVFAPSAAPCNGISVTSIIFENTPANPRTIVSGTDGTRGVIYRYSKAGTAPDGVVVDAIVTVSNYANNQDATPNTFRNADIVDDGAATPTAVGYSFNLQPSIEPETNTFSGAAGGWVGSITYTIEFVVSGTNTPKRITVAATSIDNDGAPASATTCNSPLRESVIYSSNRNQTLINTSTPTPGTTQTVSGDTVAGPATVQNGIGTGPEYSNSALFVNVTNLTWTYSFATATTATCSPTQATQDRFGSLNMNCQITFNQPFASVALNGNVYNDTNGLTDSIVNGTGTGTPSSTQLYANLVDSNGFVVSSVAVTAGGAYSFSTAVSGTYTVQISTNQGVESSAAPAIALPAGWVNTGENIGTTAGNDGSPNGSIAVTVGATAITNVNFGIEQRPTAVNSTTVSQANPGGTTSVTVPATNFAAADTAPGTVSSIRITALPTNATSITINGVIYGTGGTAFPAGGVTVPVNASGNPTQTIAVDPGPTGNTTVAISYVAVDNAGVLSLPAIVNVPFGTGSAISGTVFNDTNGLTDSIVNGTGTNTGNTLYAILVNSSTGNVVQSVTVATGGAYSFANVTTGSYTVQLSTVAGTVGSAAPAVNLPAGWVSTGEYTSVEVGNDGSNDGKSSSLSIAGTSGTDITNVNFGIEQRPTANNNTAASQNNPGGTISATVAPTAFSGTDPVTSTVSSIRITALPTNATSVTINGILYGTGGIAFPAGGVTVPTNSSGNPTQAILVDPSPTGVTTVTFTYVAIDQAGVESAATATANIPFNLAPTAANGEISGGLYLAGQPIRNVLVVLIDTSSNTRVFTRTDNDGNYLFGEKESGRTYIIQPLSNKYAFSPSTLVINLLETAIGQNFDTSAKNYHPKNDFDGDGKTDIAVFRPTDGNWYVLKSSDEQMSVFRFGADGDVPAAADFDGDGKTDYAVFRPTDGNWYIWQSATQSLRAEQFGQVGDKIVPADFDGDGKADIAVYRTGFWYIRRSSDNSFEAINYGVNTDTPITGDFNGDKKADFSVYRPSEGTWFTLFNTTNNSSARRFGLETDVSVAEDFDGDGLTDIAQFRSGYWYILNSTTGFEAEQFGSNEDKLVAGDYDGDGRVDTAIFRDGLWVIRNSGNDVVRYVRFGSSTDTLVK